MKTSSYIEKKNELRRRVIALLTREEIDYLDKLGKDAWFSYGRKLTHTKIISFIIDVLMRLGVDCHGVKSSRDLEEKVKNAIARVLISESLVIKTNGKKEAPMTIQKSQ
jgi:hypothetical protein